MSETWSPNQVSFTIYFGLLVEIHLVLFCIVSDRVLVTCFSWVCYSNRFSGAQHNLFARISSYLHWNNSGAYFQMKFCWVWTSRVYMCLYIHIHVFNIYVQTYGICLCVNINVYNAVHLIHFHILICLPAHKNWLWNSDTTKILLFVYILFTIPGYKLIFEYIHIF